MTRTHWKMLPGVFVLCLIINIVTEPQGAIDWMKVIILSIVSPLVWLAVMLYVAWCAKQ